jgi:hypothetical protein
MPNWYPGDSFALGIPRFDRQPPVEGLVEMSRAVSSEPGPSGVSGHPPLGMNEACWRIPTLCWMRKERQPDDQPSGQTRSP